DAVTNDPFDVVHDIMGQLETKEREEGPAFQYGAVGYVSYDYARQIERLPNVACDDLQEWDVHLTFYEEVFVYELTQGRLWLMGCYAEAAGSVPSPAAQLVAFTGSCAASLEFPKWTSEKEGTERTYAMSEETFIDAVERIRSYILAGDVFQVNLAIRQSEPLHVHPLAVYHELRSLNPSPYMAYLEIDDRIVVSGSPELLVSRFDDEIATRPIAGTRSRGRDEAEDRALENELLDSRKERAEHIMLVDLERNDLGRVSAYGTVEVDELMVVERYSHVMHLVSNVKGTLRQGVSSVDCLRAMFPGGTITGAPKIRTMEIIEELEPVRRGLYTGAIGWYDCSGDMTWNIVIRTMVVKDGVAHVQSGAGVVIDSNPKHEYKESLKKAMAVWRAKAIAEERGASV
ncbi:MAG: anthranilate synthase component I family protein, partial [Bacilli bacterium]